MSSSSFSHPRLGASKEELVQCPYQSFHYIRPIKLDDHVVKCRLNYQDDLRKKGEHSYLLSCQYNQQHKVPDKEWTFHMTRCPDRKRIWSYQLRAGPLKAEFPNMLVVTAEDFPQDQNELWEMYSGLDEGQLVGIGSRGKLVKVKDIGKDAKQLAQEEAEEKGRALAKEVEEEWREGIGKETARVPPPPPPPEASFEAKYSQDEIDYWNGPGLNKGSSFNWMNHISQPRGYNIITYPPGLTKSQRREFERKNAEEDEKRIAKAQAEENKKKKEIAILEELLVEEADREEEPLAEVDYI